MQYWQSTHGTHRTHRGSYSHSRPARLVSYPPSQPVRHPRCSINIKAIAPPCDPLLHSNSHSTRAASAIRQWHLTAHTSPTRLSSSPHHASPALKSARNALATRTRNTASTYVQAASMVDPRLYAQVHADRSGPAHFFAINIRRVRNPRRRQQRGWLIVFCT